MNYQLRTRCAISVSIFSVPEPVRRSFSEGGCLSGYQKSIIRRIFSNVSHHFSNIFECLQTFFARFCQLHKKAIVMALPALCSFSETGWTKAGLLWRDTLHASQDTTFIFNHLRRYFSGKI